jgi:hypothetical protein
VHFPMSSTGVWSGGSQLKEFGPDNVRLIGNRLITAGMIMNEPSCGGPPKKAEDIFQCPHGWIVDAIDPNTMAVTEIGRGPAAPPYSGTAMAIPVGNEGYTATSDGEDQVRVSFGLG